MILYMVIRDTGWEGYETPSAVYTDKEVAEKLRDFLNEGNKYKEYFISEIKLDENIEAVINGYFLFEAHMLIGGDPIITKQPPYGEFSTSPIYFPESNRKYVWAKNETEARILLLGEFNEV